jgi:hypothetical protein
MTEKIVLFKWIILIKKNTKDSSSKGDTDENKYLLID